MAYDVEATWDGGQTWFPISIDQGESNIVINTKNWPNTDQANIRVNADNGIETSTISTGEFAKQGQHRISWISTTDFSTGNDVTLIVDSTDVSTTATQLLENAIITDVIKAGNE